MSVVRGVDDGESVGGGSSAGGAVGVVAVVEHLGRVRAELESADGVRASAWLAELDAVAAMVEGLRLLAISRVEASGVWRDDPNATAASFLRARHRRSHPESAADLRAAQALNDFPVLRQAVDEGSVSRAHVDVMVGIGQRNAARAAVLPDFLPAFIRIARAYPAGTLRQVMRRWADQVDPLATAGDEQAAHRRRFLHVTQVGDGVAVDGFFGRDQGAKILAALNAALTEDYRRNQTSDAEAGGVGVVVSTGQRRADAFISLMDRVLADGGLPATGGARAAVTVLVPLARLEQPCPTPTEREDLLAELGDGQDVDPRHLFATGTGQLGVSNGPGADLISAQAAQRLTCDCEIHRIVLDPDGLPLDVGRKMRTFPPHLRKALEVRDGGCVFPGCSKPPGWAEAHHIVHWAHGGTTSLDNAALLCSRHHHDVHTNNHTVTITATGRATVTLNKRRC